MKKLGMTLLMSVSLTVQAGEDPYVQGFEVWAKELAAKGDKSLAGSVRSYVADIHAAKAKAGYLGERVPLPEPVKVTDGVYTIVGSMIWHNPANYGFNNNLSFAIFAEGVFVYNAGPNYAVAASAHDIIRRYTNKPVKWVVMENNQGHAMLGAGYWLSQGAKLYSAATAARQFGEAFDAIKAEWSRRVGENLTAPAENVSDRFITFDGEMVLEVGGGEKVYLWEEAGHTPSATSAWVPSRKVFFAGDLLFNERSLALFAYTDSLKWAESIQQTVQKLPEDAIVVPGHGHPADLKTTVQHTLGYLRYMHREIQKVIDQGGTLEDALAVDQSQFKNRPVFEQTYKRNAAHIYRELGGL